MVCTSPPYWCLRDYKVDGQLGLEKTPDAYVGTMVEVFREVKRVLRDDGTLWLNMGDSYASSTKMDGGYGSAKQASNRGSYNTTQPVRDSHGLKEKDLVGIPWRLAFALQADGWYLRSDIIWAKRNCMPESVTDRPTRSHEYLFLLAQSSRYYYDAEAIKEPAIYDVDGTGTAARKARQQPNAKSLPTAQRSGIRPAGFKNATKANGKHSDKQRGHSRRHDGFNDRWDHMTKEEQCTGYRNKRDVWFLATAQFPEAHFATFPEKLVEPCIRAGTSEKGCCASCGAPWEREVRKSFVPQTDVSLERGIKGATGQKPMDESNGWEGFPRGSTTAETVGWHPTCSCHAEAIPGTVLDPFTGSGTTGVVALKLGRSFIGLELNPEYVTMARRRIGNVMPLFEAAP